VERELVMTGIGGQGIQLASSVLASAALAEGREVQLFGSYGGMMRGGATEASLVFADGPIEAPPTLSASWSVIFMHHEHAEHARACLRPGTLALVNSTVHELKVKTDDVVIFGVPATDIAIDVGHAMTASMVMIGAYAALTAIVSEEALTDAVRAALPPYRRQHIELNERALVAGASAVQRSSVPAWPTAAGAAS
jgi:2-oxoglutarate ferredoxin oxidoreductase subunit gamma